MLHFLESFLSGNYITSSSIATILTIVCMAAVSESLGYSAVLYINRVPINRFILSLLSNVFLYSFGIFFWLFSIWTTSRFVFLSDVSVLHLFKAVALAYIPQVISFLVFIPFFGNAIRAGLNLLSLVLLIIFVQDCVQLLLWQSVLCVLIGFIAREVLQHKIANPVTRFASNLRNRAAGKEILVTKQELEPYFNTQQKQLNPKALNYHLLSKPIPYTNEEEA